MNFQEIAEALLEQVNDCGSEVGERLSSATFNASVDPILHPRLSQRNRGDYGRRQRSRQRARGSPATDSRLPSLPPARPCWSESVPSLSAAAAIVIPEVCLCPHRSVVSSRSLRQEMHLPSCSPSWPSSAPLAPDPAVRALDRVELAIGVLAHLHGFPRPRASVRLVLSPGTRRRLIPFIR